MVDSMELTKSKLSGMKEDERAVLIFIYEDRDQLIRTGFIEKVKKLGDLI